LVRRVTREAALGEVEGSSRGKFPLCEERPEGGQKAITGPGSSDMLLRC
jgi:hypothetical protein